MAWPDPAWEATVRQQNRAYQDKIDNDLKGATYQQAAGFPRLWGNSPLANALTQRAGPPNNPATGLFDPKNPFNFYLAQYMANAPGGNTIDLPGADASDQSNLLLSGLLNRTGVG